MSRLQSEWRRLYLSHSTDGDETDLTTDRLVDDDARVRAMVLEVARPADWQALSAVWRGVQTDLALPAPAIAVSGLDGYQLWFSLAEPLPAARAFAFLEALRVRYLSGVGPERIRMLPAMDAVARQQIQHASTVPSEVQADQWSAFVAPDLAPVFAETPWLDFPPSEQGQAELLAQLVSIAPADLQRAEAALNEPLAPTAPEASTTTEPNRHEAGSMPCTPDLDPRRFLLKVMNDHTVAMALRIEAAKALLPFSDAPSRS